MADFFLIKIEASSKSGIQKTFTACPVVVCPPFFLRPSNGLYLRIILSGIIITITIPFSRFGFFFGFFFGVLRAIFLGVFGKKNFRRDECLHFFHAGFS